MLRPLRLGLPRVRDPAGSAWQLGPGKPPRRRLPKEFSGGHEIGKNDFGRPVPLIAAALGVPPDDFRKAFSGVTPSRGGPPSAGFGSARTRRP